MTPEIEADYAEVEADLDWLVTVGIVRRVGIGPEAMHYPVVPHPVFRVAAAVEAALRRKNGMTTKEVADLVRFLRPGTRMRNIHMALARLRDEGKYERRWGTLSTDHA